MDRLADDPAQASSSAINAIMPGRSSRPGPIDKGECSMKFRFAVMAGVLFVSGIAVGYAAQKTAPSLYRDKGSQEAARALLELATEQADGGSWELIAIGRVYYLGGAKAEGQAIFDKVLAHKPEESDLFRIARVYQEAGDWPQAKALFDRYMATDPGDAGEIAMVGSYYMLHGDRAAAETLFDRSFGEDADFWANVAAAGSYLGVEPQE
jgi:tetratricopeptide (TPR) repeat protein